MEMKEKKRKKIGEKSKKKFRIKNRKKIQKKSGEKNPKNLEKNRNSFFFPFLFFKSETNQEKIQKKYAIIFTMHSTTDLRS